VKEVKEVKPAREEVRQTAASIEERAEEQTPQAPASQERLRRSGESRNKTPVFEPGFVGLMVSPDPPHAVSAVHDLVDTNGVVQGAPGYQNERVDAGDFIMSINNHDVRRLSVDDLHELLYGEFHSAVEIVLQRKETMAVYTVKVLRHLKHEYSKPPVVGTPGAASSSDWADPELTTRVKMEPRQPKSSLHTAVQETGSPVPLIVSNQGPPMTSPPEANSNSPHHSMGAFEAAALPDPVQLTMTLGMTFHETGEEGSSKREAFKLDLANDLAKASGLPAENFKISKLSAGSVIVDLDILPDPLGIAPAPSVVARDLEKQAADPNSPLRSGKLTSQTKGIQVLSLQPASGAPPPPPTQRIVQEAGSPVPPFESLPAPPIPSEPPTAKELSKEEVAIQPQPSQIEAEVAAPATSPVPKSINDEPNPSRTSSSALPLPTVKDMVTEQPQQKESEAAFVTGSTSIVPNSVTPVKSITEVHGATGTGRGRPGLLFYPNADHCLVINDVIVGTHAAESGIEIGDFIVKVQGESIEGQPVDVVMEAFAGPMGSELTVTVRKHLSDKKVRFILIRDLQVASQHPAAIALPRSLSGSCTLSLPKKGSSTPRNLPTKDTDEGSSEMPRAVPGVGVRVYTYAYIYMYVCF